VLLSGEPGIGKTRLQQELSRCAQGRIAAWLGCTCSAYHRNSALYPIIEQLTRTVGLKPGEEAKESLARLEGWIESLELPVPETAPSLAALLSLPTEGYEVATLGPERQRQQLLSVLIGLVRHLARRKPVVLVMEDLQWADPSTRELLERLAAQIEHEKVLAIFAYRPEAEAVWSALPRASRLELRRLEQGDAEAMLDRWVELPPGLRREVLARTDGIPLFLEELTRAVVADGAKRAEGAGPRGAAVREPLIPATLHSSLIARLDGLGPAKETAQLAALLGRTFRHDMLRAASLLEPRMLEEHLERLVGSGLLERVGSPRDAAFHFRQSLLQETAYESLLRSRRRQLHEHVAVALGEAFPDLARNEPETLARHYEAAGRWPEALRFHRSAGGRAVERGAYVEAIASFRKALELLEHLSPGDERNRDELGLLQLLVVPIFAHHGYAAPELPRIYASIRELTRDLGGSREEAWQLLTSWAFHLVRSDRTETRMLADEMVALAARAPEVLGDAQLGYVLGYNAFYSGDQPRALRELERAMAPGEGGSESPLASAEAAFHASLARGWSLAVVGRGEAAWQMLAASVAAAEAVGQPFALAQALAYLAAVAQETGRDARELQAIAERLLKIAIEQDLQIWICFGHIFRGWARAMLGEEDGVVELRSAIEASLAGGHLTSMGHSLLMLATALGQLGRTQEALEVVERALDFGAKHLERFSVADAQRVRGELLRLLGEHAAAESSLRGALATAREQGARLFGLRAATSLAQLLQEQGRLGEARACLAPCLAEVGDGATSAWLHEAQAVLAGLEAAGVAAAR
jgi:tetratricopeptide (TPR) repeat protein